ncbi:hypothetical protein C9W97_25720 [Salmonella enterica subsp. enterica serovar Enteritidis]|nr:hypothetical protein [Salmonella enterica subsp. enterica serovar Enteritidis]ECI7685970.1 hypothetical protein [Salmonella enterica subsp. enterica serovar Paratyphi A]
MLQSIVALLFSLANAAELAAFAPDHIRRYVLQVLRIAEPAAHELVFGVGQEPDPPAFLDPDSPAAAMLAAQRLRAMARILLAMIAQGFVLWRGAVTGFVIVLEALKALRPAPAAPALAFHDTS